MKTKTKVARAFLVRLYPLVAAILVFPLSVYGQIFVSNVTGSPEGRTGTIGLYNLDGTALNPVGSDAITAPRQVAPGSRSTITLCRRFRRTPKPGGVSCGTSGLIYID
jgi:hypothetical protein